MVCICFDGRHLPGVHQDRADFGQGDGQDGEYDRNDDQKLYEGKTPAFSVLHGSLPAAHTLYPI